MTEKPTWRAGHGTPAAPLSDQALAECVRASTAAPSLHNSQPWRFRIRNAGVDVFADWDRRLDVIDPTGRELLISVGAAVFTLRLAVRSRGMLPILTLFPDPAEPHLVARVEPGRPVPSTDEVDVLAGAIPRRHTNRWPFAPTVVPIAVIERLVLAARCENAGLDVAGAVARTAILSLAHTAERRLRKQGAYRAELARWTVPGHGRREGLPASVIGPWDALETLPMRDFGLAQPDLTRTAEQFEAFPTILLLSTGGDSHRHWVSAGQALQRVLLVATTQNLATTPISQPLEIPGIRQLLTDTGKGTWAQMVVRVGYGQPAPATPRRPLAEVLQTEVQQAP